jgi:hypothetical protein
MTPKVPPGLFYRKEKKPTFRTGQDGFLEAKRML